MITAVDLLRGLATLIGWQRIEVPGATGYTDTDYAAKGRAAIAALQSTDVVCVHVEATDEASHEGDVAAKVTRARGDRPAHRGTAACGVASAGPLPPAGVARSSDTAPHEDPQSRGRPIRHLWDGDSIVWRDDL